MLKVMEYRRDISALRTEAKNLFIKAQNEKRSLTDEEENKASELAERADKLEREMDTYIRVNKIPEDQLRQSEPMKPVPDIPLNPEERAKEKRAAFMKYIRGGERALKNEERALIENTAGLYYVPQDLESQILTAIPQINSFRKYAGIRNTTRDKVEFPTMGAVTVGWGKLETGTIITESTPTPNKITIYVEDEQVLIKLGKDEMMDAEANLVAAIVEQASIALANDEAKMFAVGRGHTTYNEPDGITLASISHTDWTTADTLKIDDMLACEYGLGAQYLNGSAWLMHRITELKARQYKEAVASGYYGNYMWQPSLQLGQPNNFDGFPIFNQNDMGYASQTTDLIEVVFGNFKVGYKIVDRQGITIQRLDELYAESGMVGFIIGKRVGGGTIDTSAFYGIGNANT
jgi:HK97 family phage major capsid protein